MNTKEELRKEFETWYFKDFDRQDFDSDEELQEAKDSNTDFIDELVEWFWKHLEQREKLISDYEKDVGRLKVERASLYDLLEAAEEIIKQSPVGTTHRKEALESYTTLKQQMK